MADDYLPNETREQYVARRVKVKSDEVGRKFRFWRHTKARPKTQEYKRLANSPQHSGHITCLDEEFPLLK